MITKPMTQKITAIFGIAVMAAILFGGLTISQSAFAGIEEDPRDAGKVTICHNGDDGPETIEVSGNAVDKHMNKHGDTLGECEESPPTCLECALSAEIEFNQCRDDGGSEAQCFTEVEPSLTDCALTCEGSDIDKENACFTAGIVQFNVCLFSGEDPVVCEDSAVAFINACSGLD